MLAGTVLQSRQKQHKGRQYFSSPPVTVSHSWPAAQHAGAPLGPQVLAMGQLSGRRRGGGNHGGALSRIPPTEGTACCHSTHSRCKSLHARTSRTHTLTHVHAHRHAHAHPAQTDTEHTNTAHAVQGLTSCCQRSTCPARSTSSRRIACCRSTHLTGKPAPWRSTWCHTAATARSRRRRSRSRCWSSTAARRCDRRRST